MHPIVELTFSLLVHAQPERYAFADGAEARLSAALAAADDVGAAAHALADAAELLHAQLGCRAAAALIQRVLMGALPRLKRVAGAQAQARTAAAGARGRRFTEAQGRTAAARAPMFGAPPPAGAISLRTFLAGGLVR